MFTMIFRWISQSMRRFRNDKISSNDSLTNRDDFHSVQSGIVSWTWQPDLETKPRENVETTATTGRRNFKEYDASTHDYISFPTADFSDTSDTSGSISELMI